MRTVKNNRKKYVKRSDLPRGEVRFEKTVGKSKKRDFTSADIDTSFYFSFRKKVKPKEAP